MKWSRPNIVLQIKIFIFALIAATSVLAAPPKKRPLEEIDGKSSLEFSGSLNESSTTDLRMRMEVVPEEKWTTIRYLSNLYLSPKFQFLSRFEFESRDQFSTPDKLDNYEFRLSLLDLYTKTFRVNFSPKEKLALKLSLVGSELYLSDMPELKRSLHFFSFDTAKLAVEYRTKLSPDIDVSACGKLLFGLIMPIEPATVGEERARVNSSSADGHLRAEVCGKIDFYNVKIEDHAQVELFGETGINQMTNRLQIGFDIDSEKRESTIMNISGVYTKGLTLLPHGENVDSDYAGIQLTFYELGTEAK